MRKLKDKIQDLVFDSYPKILDAYVNDPLRIEDLNDGKNWKVLEGMQYEVQIQDEKDSIPYWVTGFIPPNFITDLASVDGIPLVKIDKLTIGNRNYVLHDLGYQKNPLNLTQKHWDTIMLIGLKNDGAPVDLSWRRWLGVQIGGRKVWKNYRAK